MHQVCQALQSALGHMGGVALTSDAEATIQRQHAVICEMQAQLQISMRRIHTLVQMVMTQQALVAELRRDMLSDNSRQESMVDAAAQTAPLLIRRRVAQERDSQCPSQDVASIRRAPPDDPQV